MSKLRNSAIAGPLVWIIGMALDWTFAWPNCVNGKVYLLIGVNVITCLTASFAAISAFRLRETEPFRATVVGTLDAIFAFLIVAQTMPLLLFRGCA